MGTVEFPSVRRPTPEENLRIDGCRIADSWDIEAWSQAPNVFDVDFVLSRRPSSTEQLVIEQWREEPQTIGQINLRQGLYLVHNQSLRLTIAEVGHVHQNAAAFQAHVSSISNTARQWEAQFEEVARSRARAITSIPFDLM